MDRRNIVKDLNEFAMTDPLIADKTNPDIKEIVRNFDYLVDIYEASILEKLKEEAMTYKESYRHPKTIFVLDKLVIK